MLATADPIAAAARKVAHAIGSHPLRWLIANSRKAAGRCDPIPRPIGNSSSDAAIGSAVASILSRTLGDTTPILIGIATGIAGFLAIGLRWFDHEAPSEPVGFRPAISDGPGSPGLD
ncbi:MAG: hypothetical protein EBU21_17210 [Proteobacteria bacterium]|nr:hypothetical protein [Pseudomonadota bacterium]